MIRPQTDIAHIEKSMKEPYRSGLANVISWLRFPLIMGVLLTHCNLYALVTSWEGTCPEWPAWLIFIFNGLYLAAMPPIVPALFVISGYLFFRSQAPRDKSFFIYKYRRRAHSLLVPYLAWNTIAIIILFVRFNIIEGKGYTVPEYLSGYWSFSPREGGDPADGPLWYIRDLMTVSLAAPLFYIFLRKKVAGILFLAFVILMNALDIAIPAPGFSNTSIVFFSIGAYLAIHNIDISRIPDYIGIGASILYIPSQLALGNISEDSAYIYAAYMATAIIKITAAFYIVSVLFRKDMLSPTPRLTRLCFTLYALHGIVVGPIIKTLYYHVPPQWQPCCIACNIHHCNPGNRCAYGRH